MDALAFKCVQIAGQRFCKRLTFTGTHFRNFAAMQNDTADHLHIEMPHPHDTLGSFANRSECFGENIVERFTRRQAVAEKLGLLRQTLIRHFGDFRF